MRTSISPPDRLLARRGFLTSGALAAAGFTLAGRAKLLAAEAGKTSDRFVVEDIRRTTVRLPYRETPKRAMDRELPHWRYIEVFEVALASGEAGLGETLLYYTWGVSNDGHVKRALGANAVELMWDDSLGAGLQMALFDAVARTVGVPVHRLLGRKVHDQTPVSWWNIDMPPEDLAAECQLAHQQGYLAYKTKGRPWFDLWEQVERAASLVPDEFAIDMDFNDTLLTADRAIPILQELERYPQIQIYETPIPQGDIEGNQRICAATRVDVAMHYGSPAPREAIKHGVCDGFVIGGGARSVIQAGDFAAMAGMPFWLQLVGSGITAAFSLHFGAVLQQARWPAVNCHQLYAQDLIDEPIVIRAGMADVPQGPGLGYRLNRETIERFRTERPTSRPDPQRLLETTWPDGRVMYTASNGQVNFMLGPAMKGKTPFFERGVKTRPLPNDGSQAWRKRFEKAQDGPYVERR